MKTKNSIFIFFLLNLFACSNSDTESDAYGNFEAVETIISAEASGKILSFDIEEGQKIEKNTLIGQIDSTLLYLKMAQLDAQKQDIQTATSDILSQIAVLDEQKKNLNIEKKRLENLLKDEAASQKQLDDLNGQIRVIDRQIESIRTKNSTVLSKLNIITKQVDELNELIARCRIINPLTGMVMSKYAEPLEMTAVGKPLYKIANLSKMTLRVYVSGDQLPHILLGQKVVVLMDENKDTNREIEGTVMWISSNSEFTPKTIQTKEERVNLVYAVKIQVNNTEGHIKIGMPGEIRFAKTENDE